MRLFRSITLCLLATAFLASAGCGGSIHVSDNNASVKVPPGQVQKQMTPGHNK